MISDTRLAKAGFHRDEPACRAGKDFAELSQSILKLISLVPFC
jgi:hypothetical protein